MPSALQVLLLLVALSLLAAESAFGRVFVSVLAVGVSVFLGAPRWVAYSLLGVGLLLFVASFALHISTGPQDSDSDRDEAVEVAAQALMAGQNPWAQTTHRYTLITTGPASVLFATPWVRLFHRINELTFIAYVALFAFLLAGDVRCQNETFLGLGLFFLTGVFGFQHTLYWSLDELYFGYVALVTAWVLLRRGWLSGAGACLAFALGSRVSYALPIFGLLCWYWHGREVPARDLVRLGVGAAVGVVLVVLPFWVVAGRDLLVHNPMTAAGALLESDWPPTNPLFRGLNLVRQLIGPTATSALKLVGSLAVVWYAAVRLRRFKLAHPFWHVCLAGFLADMGVYRAGLQDDYVLFFVIPAFLAIAHSGPGRHPTPT